MMLLSALVLLAGGIFPFMCGVVPDSADLPAYMQHAHAHDSEMPLLLEPVTSHDCAAIAPPQVSREGGPGLAASLAMWRNPVLMVEPLSPAIRLLPNRDVSIRAMFQVYRL